MKKLLIVGVSTIALAYNSAAINSGVYDLSNGVENGQWGESFTSSGGAGQLGNMLAATGFNPTDSSIQWVLFGLVLGPNTPTETPPGSGWYTTDYYPFSNLPLFLYNGPWGDGGLIFIQSASNYSHSEVLGQNLEFTFTASGTTLDGRAAQFVATYNSDNDDSYAFDYATGQSGAGFSSLQLTVFPTPDGGATIGLLGLGLLGLVGFRRKG